MKYSVVSYRVKWPLRQRIRNRVFWLRVRWSRRKWTPEMHEAEAEYRAAVHEAMFGTAERNRP